MNIKWCENNLSAQGNTFDISLFAQYGLKVDPAQSD